MRFTCTEQKQELVEVVRRKIGDVENVSQSSQPDVVLRRNDFQNSTKLEALIKDLRAPTFLVKIYETFLLTL